MEQENQVWERPYAAAAKLEYWKQGGQQCFVCFKTNDDPIVCKDCDNAYYCSEECQTTDSDRTLQHKFECRAFQSAAKSESDLISIRMANDARLVARILVRMSVDGGNSSSNDIKGFENFGALRTVEDMMSHSEQFIGGLWPSKWMIFAKYFKSQSDSPFADVTESQFLEIYGKIRTNCFNIGAPASIYEICDGIATAFYLQASRFDHSCDPTLKGYWQDAKIVLEPYDKSVSLFDAPPDSLRISYKCWEGTLASRHDRQEILNETFHFICDCRKCADVTSDLIAWNGLAEMCAECSSPLVPDLSNLEGYTYLNPRCFLLLTGSVDTVCLRCKLKQGHICLDKFQSELKSTILNTMDSGNGGFWKSTTTPFDEYSKLRNLKLLNQNNAWLIVAYESLLYDTMEKKLREKSSKLEETLLICISLGELIIAGYEHYKVNSASYPVLCAKIGQWYCHGDNMPSAKVWYSKARAAWKEFYFEDHACVSGITKILRSLD